MTMARALILITVAALTNACAHSDQKSLTAIEHRNEAELHKAASERAAAKYDPGSSVKAPGRGPFVDGPNGLSTYNPTAAYLEDADRELRKAAEHLAQARALERFADLACREIPPAERAACPFLASSVTLVREVPSGLELELKPTVDARDTHRRLNCHLAWAQANGFERPSCPLFFKGLTLAVREGPVNVLLFDGDTPEVANVLRAQARLLFRAERFAP